MTLPQGIWTSNSNIITPAVFTATAPAYVKQSTSGVILGNQVASLGNRQIFTAAADFTTSYVMPSSPTYVATQQLIAMPYTPTIPTGTLIFEISLPVIFNTNTSSPFGAVACLYNSSLSTATPIKTFVNTEAETGSGVYSQTYTYRYRYQLPSTPPPSSSYYLCVGGYAANNLPTFVSTSSPGTTPYFGALCGCYVVITNGA